MGNNEKEYTIRKNETELEIELTGSEKLSSTERDLVRTMINSTNFSAYGERKLIVRYRGQRSNKGFILQEMVEITNTAIKLAKESLKKLEEVTKMQYDRKKLDLKVGMPIK